MKTTPKMMLLNFSALHRDGTPLGLPCLRLPESFGVFPATLILPDLRWFRPICFNLSFAQLLFLVYTWEKSLLELPYIYKVWRCTACHSNKSCKSIAPERRICERCTRNHDRVNSISPEISCANCVRTRIPTSEHMASDKNCPVFNRQKRINKIIPYHGVSPKEAADNLDSGGGSPRGVWTAARPSALSVTLWESFSSQNIRLGINTERLLPTTSTILTL